MLSSRPRTALLSVSWQSLATVIRARPSMQACLGLMLGIAWAEFGSSALGWGLVGVAGLLALGFPRLWVVALAFSIGWLRYTGWQPIAEPLPPEQTTLRAVGTLEPTRSGHRLLCAIEEPARQGYALAYFRPTVESTALPDYGDRFRLKAEWSRPRNWHNLPFDWARHLQRRRIQHVAFVYHAGQVQIQQSGAHRWQRQLQRAYRSLRENLRARLTPATASITEGMLVGASSDFPSELREAFMRSGIGHLLATSGLHVGIVLHMLGGLLLVVGVRFSARVGCVIAFAWLYALIAGMRPSIVRAGIMATLALSAPLVRREPDGLSALAMAGILWLLYAPYSLFEVGFQCSFSAVLCILLFYGRLSARLQRGWQRLFAHPITVRAGTHFLCPLLSVTLCAQIGTAPIQIYHFGYFGWLSTIANLLTVPLAYPILALGFLFWVSQGWLAGYLLEWLCGWLGWVAQTFGAPCVPVLTIANLPAWGVIGFYGVLLLLASEPTFEELGR